MGVGAIVGVLEGVLEGEMEGETSTQTAIRDKTANMKSSIRQEFTHFLDIVAPRTFGPTRLVKHILALALQNAWRGNKHLETKLPLSRAAYRM